MGFQLISTDEISKFSDFSRFGASTFDALSCFERCDLDMPRDSTTEITRRLEESLTSHRGVVSWTHFGNVLSLNLSHPKRYYMYMYIYIYTYIYIYNVYAIYICTYIYIYAMYMYSLYSKEIRIIWNVNDVRYGHITTCTISM